MQLTGNTILITGGGSGIGRGLAEEFHKRGNTVIIAGRRAEVLKETAEANPGVETAVLDIEDPVAIKSFAADLLKRFPQLNAVLHNAGIMKTEKLFQEEDASIAEQTIATNLLGPIRLNAVLLPHLLQQPRATVLTVTSGLASVPLAMNATYCATKAALHSWTESLRFQLRKTAIAVIEIVPPYVQTSLTGERQASDPTAMPLAEYIAETIAILEHEPEVREVLVDRVKPLRFAERDGKYQEIFLQRSESLAKLRGGE